ncbi:hypothetical protein [Owenweeksia hongkongensis]|uniref:hypothetical protein n=1 Tax=Owenweeksia hongkongensis TaxID=253245 RepID=UPI003A9304A2
MKNLFVLLGTMYSMILYGQTHLTYTNEVMANIHDSTIGDSSTIDKVAIYGAGGLLGLVSSAEKPEGTQPISGSLGFSFKSPSQKWAFSLFYSVNGATEVDVSTYSQLGSALMAPPNNGNSVNLNVVKRSTIGIKPGYFGWVFSGAVSANDWKVDSNTTYKLAPVLAKFGGYWRPFPFDLGKDNRLNIYGTVLYTYRGAIGDLFNGNTTSIMIENEEYKLRSYHGFEVGIHAMFNNVALSALFPVNFTDKELPGFTGAQFLIKVEVSGDILIIGK